MSDLANAPAHDAGQQAAPLQSLTAAEARARLAAEATAGAGAGEARKVKALPLSAIEPVERLFQPREINEYHVTDMVKGSKAGDELPALLVYWRGSGPCCWMVTTAEKPTGAPG